MFKCFSRRAVQVLVKNNRIITTVERRNKSQKMDPQWLSCARDCVPALSGDRHKGQAGRIGVIGGCADYTGAPYYAAMSCLRLGADLVHVFCATAAGPVIKAYSPELIVHAVLDTDTAVDDIEAWLERLHVLVIGPGLGRDARVMANVCRLIERCRVLKKPLVIDADGLWLVTQMPDCVRDNDAVVLTPNAIEFNRLFGDATAEQNVRALGVSVLHKGAVDRFYRKDGAVSMQNCYPVGSGRRCGGQGDVLAGVIATFYGWALAAETAPDVAQQVACWAGSVLVRETNRQAFAGTGRGMLTTDMIPLIPKVFAELFETPEKLAPSTARDE